MVAARINVRQADAALLKVGAVRRAVFAHRRHDQRRAAQEFERIGDIARAATKFAAQLGHIKRDIELVNLLRQDLVGKLAAKIHDAVKGE